MTASFDPRHHRFPQSRYFEDLTLGERFYIPSRTVTEAHFAAFQTLSAATTRSTTMSSIAASAATPARSRTDSRSWPLRLRAPALLPLRSVTR